MMNNDKFAKIIGEILRDIRCERRLSLFKVESLTSISTGKISRLENGNKRLTVLNIVKLCNTYHVNPAFVLHEALVKYNESA